MVRTNIFCKVTDSDASPYIEQKDVILCRSGIQLYSYNEVVRALGEPPVKKDYYREYRPANVVVDAQDKCKSLPVTKEHPETWVTPDNWKDLAGGVLDREVSVVALDGESEGEIGIKSNVTFFTRELYDYYLNNKEVSLGYTCKKHFVENPDEVGYDIILDEITEVNHLAITRAGRGGSSVAVIDSIIGGLKPMRTGIFAYLASKMQKDSKDTFSFGGEVLKAVKNSKGTSEEELAKEMKGVLDSMSVLKDCEAKDTLVDVVKDCFDNKDKALANEAELTATLDSMWIDIHSDSLSEIAKAFDKLSKKVAESKPDTETKDSEEKKDEKEEDNKDSEEKKDEKEEDNKDSEEKKDEKKDEEDNKDSEEKKDEKEEDNKDSEEKKDEKEKKDEDGCHGTSAKDDILSMIKDSLPALVKEAVQEVLGIKDNKSASVTGCVVDSDIKETENNLRDYSSFLE